MFKQISVGVLIACGIMASGYTNSAHAWDGTDDDGNDISIDAGNIVRAGETITIEQNGEEKEVTVDSVETNGVGATVEMTDEETGDPISADMN